MHLIYCPKPPYVDNINVMINTFSLYATHFIYYQEPSDVDNSNVVLNI